MSLSLPLWCFQWAQNFSWKSFVIWILDTLLYYLLVSNNVVQKNTILLPFVASLGTLGLFSGPLLIINFIIICLSFFKFIVLGMWYTVWYGNLHASVFFSCTISLITSSPQLFLFLFLCSKCIVIFSYLFSLFAIFVFFFYFLGDFYFISQTPHWFLQFLIFINF